LCPENKNVFKRSKRETVKEEQKALPSEGRKKPEERAQESFFPHATQFYFFSFATRKFLSARTRTRKSEKVLCGGKYRPFSAVFKIVYFYLIKKD